jgi:hypothetical protein
MHGETVKNRLWVFVYRVLKTTSESKKGGCKRKLQNEELRDFQFSSNSIHMVRSRPLGKPRRRWEDNIKMIFRKWEGVVGTGLSRLRIGTGGEHL